MATVYAEAVLAQETRIVKEDKTVLGGPVYYIKKAYNNGFGKALAGFFSVAIILALGFMGCMVQSNSIGATCSTAFGIPSWVMGVVVALFGRFYLPGRRRPDCVRDEKLVPVMAALYLLGGLVVLALRFRYIPETFALIFRYAFMPNAIIGGSFGYALKMAISPGCEAGPVFQ